MTNIKRILFYRVVGTVLLTGSLFLLAVFLWSYKLPYNEMGSYLDPQTGITWQVRQVFIYGMASMIGIGSGGFSFFMAHLSKNMQPNTVNKPQN